MPQVTPARWSVDRVESLFDLLFQELIHSGQMVFRKNFDPNRIEFATLLLINAGGYKEEWDYFPYAVCSDGES